MSLLGLLAAVVLDVHRLPHLPRAISHDSIYQNGSASAVMVDRGASRPEPDQSHDVKSLEALGRISRVLRVHNSKVKRDKLTSPPFLPMDTSDCFGACYPAHGTFLQKPWEGRPTADARFRKRSVASASFPRAVGRGGMSDARVGAGVCVCLSSAYSSLDSHSLRWRGGSRAKMRRQMPFGGGDVCQNQIATA